MSLVGLLALAQRQIMPEGLRDKPAGEILAALSKDMNLDDTNFAKLSGFLDKGFLAAERRLISSMQEVLSDRGFQEILANPMIVGWAYQCLVSERRISFGLSDEYQRLTTADIALTDLPVLTQWFTPEWIGHFLVSEALSLVAGQKQITLIDPCLGTGHIFVEALKQRLKQYHEQCADQLAGQIEPAAALAKILANEIFGCDLDKDVVAIAGFSIYLACRDWAPICELPLPQIFHFNGQGFGSLWLSLKGQPQADLFDLNGQADLSILQRKYSVVVTNPPYLSHRLMPRELSEFLKKNYPEGRFDLYAAFLKLSMNLLEEGGVLSLLCQQSFMSITRYEKLREELLRNCAVKVLVQLGSGVFASRKGEKVSNAIIVAQSNAEAGDVEAWRVLSDEEQLQAETRGIRQLPKLLSNTRSFEKFPGKQFVFWCPDEIQHLFDLPPLESAESGIQTSNGLFTCNNKQFVKYFWQVEERESSHYVPYDKGGGYKWYYQTPLMINWQNNGDDIRAYRKKRGQSAALPGERYYFKPGVTYSYIGTRGFKARLLSAGSVFDVASSALFADDPLYLLGFLNSSLARFLLGLLNPTINFQIGDLRRLPYKRPSEFLRMEVGRLVNEAIELARQWQTFDSQSPAYLGPALLRYVDKEASEIQLVEACHWHRQNLTRLNRQEAIIQRAIDDLVFEHYGVAEKIRPIIEADPWVRRNQQMIGEMPSDKDLLAEFFVRT